MATIGSSLNMAAARTVVTSENRPVVRLRQQEKEGYQNKWRRALRKQRRSRECVAAWDEVEELSAAASHARDKKKAAGSDSLEEYCKDNPETNECRTYDN
ncbi:unnamed protein product [Cochlearia groenlandica]